jgi:DNA-binding Lrp family transcriptional regulator
MDANDVQILAQLMGNCRQPLRLLADPLGISIAAVHKRVLVLEETGIIRRFICLLHPGLLGGRAVMLHGFGEASFTAARSRELGRDPRVFEIVMASGNYLYITLLLQPSDELPALIEMVTRATGLRDFSCDDLDLGSTPQHQLDPLDCAIALALRHQARRSVSSIARAVGATEPAIRSRLERLTERRCLMFLVDLAIGVSGDQWAVFHVRGAVDVRPRVGQGASERQARPIWASRFTSDRASTHLWVWSRTLNDLRALQDDYLATPRVESLTPHLLIGSEYFSVWVDDELRSRGGPAARALG